MPRAPVSVIIPTCDRPRLLQRALASVRAQSRPPAEIVVVDDGRDAAARPCLDGTIRLLRNGHAPGVSGARNCGAVAARHAVLAFLDDDDEWLPTYLETALAQLASRRLDVLCTDLVFRYDDGTERRPGKRAAGRLSVDDFLVRNPGLTGSNLIIRAAAYAAIGGFDESLPAATDMDFGVRLSLHGCLRYAPLHAPLVRHYQHGATRLCMRRGPAMRAGVRRFYELHGARMTAAQRDQFRRRMRELWGVDEHGRDVESP